MMYRCLSCGKVFDEPKRWKENRGEFWGSPCWEWWTGSPCCEWDYDLVNEEDLDYEDAVDW